MIQTILRAGVAESGKGAGLRVPSRRGSRVQIPPPAFEEQTDDFESFVKHIKLKDISDDEKRRYINTVEKLLKDLNSNLDNNDIIIYINKIKSEYAPRTARKKIIYIRAFLKFINHPLAGSIELPKLPKRIKMKVVKVEHVRELIKKIDSLPHPYNLRLKAAVLLTATSGMRAEELYRLTIDNIDVENRTIFIPAEIAKDYEDRVTFFSEEARDYLVEYLHTNPKSPLFSKKSILYHFEKLNTNLRIKHMRKFFSQQSDRLGMPTAVKKILMGHSLRGDVDLSYYDFQDGEELKKIYDKYWKDFKILG